MRIIQNDIQQPGLGALPVKPAISSCLLGGSNANFALHTLHVNCLSSRS